MTHRRSLAIIAAFLATPAFAQTEIGAPAGTLLEAEDPAPRSTSRVIDDAAASGGRAVTSEKDWEPIFSAAGDRFPTEGEELTVWVRHRGGPIQLKATVDGSSQEKKWNWGKSDAWKWTSLGRYPRAELGTAITIIRGTGEPHPAIDAVVLASDAAAKPAGQAADSAPAATATTTSPRRGGPQSAADAGVEGGETGRATNEPDPAAAPVAVELSIDWTQTVGPITRNHWAVADYTILKPDQAAQPEFNAYLELIEPSLVRIHHAGMANTWTDEKTRTWDVAKIHKAFADATGYGDAPIMMNIASWPEWLHDGPTLPPEKEAEYVRLTGELVRIMRDEVKREVAYWEPTNEKDNNYEREGRLQDLWNLYGKLHAEIQRIDPSAKVGGMAFTWSKPAWVDPFLEQHGDKIDFISWHNYATGKLDESNASIFQKVEGNIGGNASHVMRKLAEHPRGKEIETWLNEYNISWTWETRDPRMGNNVGALFQALVVKKMAELGMTGGTVWHIQDNIYGLLKNDGTWRTPAYLFAWGPKHLTGEMANVTTSDQTALEALAVRSDAGNAVLLLAEAGQTVTAPSVRSLMPTASASNLRAYRLDAAGASEVELADVDAPLQLPGYSLTLITERGEAVLNPPAAATSAAAE